MIGRALRQVHGTQGVSSRTMPTKEENVTPKVRVGDGISGNQPVSSASGVLAPISSNHLIHSSSAGDVDNGNQYQKPLTTGLINWIDNQSPFPQANGSTLANKNDKQNQKNALNLSSVEQIENNSEHQKAPEATVLSCSDPPVDNSDNANIGTPVDTSSIATTQQNQDNPMDVSLVVQQMDVLEANVTVNYGPIVDNSDEGNIDLSANNPVRKSADLVNVSNAVIDVNVEKNQPNEMNSSKVALVNLCSSAGKSAAKRPRSDSLYVNRDIRLRLNPPRLRQLDQPRRPVRISVPVHRYNFGMVQCSAPANS